MIQYPHIWESIEAAIGQEWLDKAAARTQLFQSLGEYAERVVGADGAITKLPPFWGDIKQVFISRQHGKCVYCETPLEYGENTGIQWDLEHFRPKRNVRAWPPVGSPLAKKYADVDTGAEASGYHLLAYCYRNYAASCKTCNTPYKSDFFPIAGQRISGSSDPSAYASELPYLIYPLGVGDSDPRHLITFDGVTAVPCPELAVDLFAWRRAAITIDFLGLNRDGLMRHRAHWLYHAIWPEIKLAERGDAEARENLRLAQTEYSPHANCASCFITLWNTDQAAAISNLAIFKQILALSS